MRALRLAALANIGASSGCSDSAKEPDINPQGPDLAASVLSTHPRSPLLELCRKDLVQRTIKGILDKVARSVHAAISYGGKPATVPAVRIHDLLSKVSKSSL